MADEVRKAYTDFRFHDATQALHGFCQLELSGRYFEIIKDRLYCDALDSPRRRSCRHACRELAKGLCTLLAPVMSFTADEAWESIPGLEGSVHEQRFPEVPVVDEPEAWAKLWQVREIVQMAAEPKRADPNIPIGTSLDAKVEVILRDAKDADRLASLGEFLEDLLVASDVTVRVDPSMNASIGAIADVNPDLRTKCPRCWNHKGRSEDRDLCARCATVVGA
jgi:isoleucyl-tRNA synthetase